ncbi:MAG: dihydroorotate dehydrogenase electron transfer subunit [Clostridia bacterium]|nr:dihydroorotate dehydrogenase electron transfer subunit [Clostridia bacterium]
MRYTQEMTTVLSRTVLAEGVFAYTVSAPQMSRLAKPGQFVQILVEGKQLRRPISLAGLDAEAGTLTFIFEIRGDGTRRMAEAKVGDTLDLVGPLGNGFPLAESEAVVLIGGGIGNPPMLPLAQHYGEKATVISGFRNAASVILQDDFAATGAATVLCTDDGSAGFAGFTTQALEAHLATHPCDLICTCGPTPMMRGVAAVAARHGIRCFVSLEERMGCGFGACVGCAVDIREKDGAVARKKVCTDGPVFEGQEVCW